MGTGELKAGVHMKAVAGYHGFNANISFTFLKQSRISIIIPHIYVLGRFLHFVAIVRCIWR